MSIVTVYAPNHLDPFDSYGLLACELLRHLDAMDVPVNAIALGEAQHPNQPADVAAITARPIRAAFGGILMGYPTSFASHGPLPALGPRVAVTMFESSRIPEEWPAWLNKCHAVVTPSHFCRDVFVDCGVTAPVHVVPLGIAETFQPVRRPVDRRPFTFLCWGDRGKRKGRLEAEQAFYRAFGDDMDYRLLIKTRDLETHVECLNANIDVISADMSEEELYELYLSCDAMVFPTKGEGFGLPPREFAATGAPVITTAWSGTADDVEEWGLPLRYTLERADWQGALNLQGLPLGNWARPDVGDLARLMRDVADNRERHSARAMERAARVHELYSWRAFAGGVLDVWNEVSERRLAAHGHRATAHAPA